MSNYEEIARRLNGLERRMEIQNARDNPAIWFNALSYGATGDGTTNDVAAITAAITAAAAAGGGIVYLPKGDYYTASVIDLDDSVHLTGSGYNTRILSDQDIAVVRINGKSRAGVSNLLIDGTDPTLAGASNHIGIRVTGDSADVNIERVWATNFANNGIIISSPSASVNSVRVTIRDCRTWNCGKWGIASFINHQGVMIVNNYTWHCGQNGIVIDDSSSGTAIGAIVNHIISGNIAWDCTDSGFVISGTRSSIITDNIAYENGVNEYYGNSRVGDGFRITNVQNETRVQRNIFSNNQSYTNYRHGLVLIAADSNIIHDNQFVNNGNGSTSGRGIYITDNTDYDPDVGSTYNKIHDNYILKNSAVDGQGGIVIASADDAYNEIYNNHIRDTTAGTWTAISDSGTDTRLGFNEGHDLAYLNTGSTDTTPSVIARRFAYRLNNASATSVTDLDDGQDGQRVILFVTNTNTTLKDVSTTGNFQLSGSSDYNMPANSYVTVIRLAGVWWELSRSAD